jgi:hypothetical protein
MALMTQIQKFMNWSFERRLGASCHYSSVSLYVLRG